MAKPTHKSARDLKNKHLWAAAGLAACSLFLSVDLWSPHTSTASDAGHASRIEVIPVPAGATGPESLVFDPDGGGPYTGVSDGRILKWQGHQLGWLEHAAVTPHHLLEDCRSSHDGEKEHLCGRPLGMQFSKATGDLYIADAHLGLMTVGRGDKLATPIVTHAQGLPLLFANGLDISQDSGLVYFTDSSTRFRRREFLSAVISGDKSGRVIRYDPQNKDVQVIASGLYYPNGIALSADGSFLLIAETTTCRILKYWLHPYSDRQPEVLVQLPGFPDNIRPSPRGGYWVALYSRRGRLMRWLLSLPQSLRELVLWLPLDFNRILSMFGRRMGKALALRISEEGEILEVMEGFGGEMVRYISEVEERNGTLWIGSVIMPHVGLYKL